MARSKVIKIAEVIERTSLSKTEIYRKIAKGEFPKQRQLSPQRVGWVESEVDEWLDRRLGFSADPHLEELLGELIG